MFTWFERRERLIGVGVYNVRSLYFCGLLLYRRWQQLTTTEPIPSEE